MMKTRDDWVQAPGGGWRLRLPCGETISAECAAEMGYGSPPDDAYVKVVEENRELHKEIRRLDMIITSVKRAVEEK